MINPDYIDFFHPVFLGIVLFASVISELVGLKPKLYYLPTWILFTILLVLATLYQYDLVSTLYSINYSAALIIGGWYIKTRKQQRAFKKAQLALDDFIVNGNIAHPKDIIYYPNNIYPDLLLYEKFLNELYVILQKRWFSKKEVRSHYLQLIDELNERSTSENEINETAHLKVILENGSANGLDKYLMDNLEKNRSFNRPKSRK